jgi:predicted dehydrogenase
MRPTFTKNYSRRVFLGSSAATAFGFMFVPSRVFGANDRLRFAGIGIGGKGSGDIDQAARHGDVVAITDCDEHSIEAKLKKFPNAKPFHDWREMFDKMAGQIDACTISTPDNVHAVAAAAAIKRGIHVYVQKPLAHDVGECRWLLELSRKHKVITQMGNQGTATDGLRRGVEVIRDGALGKVYEVHVWTNRPVWPQSPEIVSRPSDTPPVPDYLHWEQFIGPAPMRPYHPAYHPFKWRGWQDFGTGALGDMGCHTANLPFMALQLQYPNRISAVHEALNPETYPAWAKVEYQFPARGVQPPVRLVWYEGHFPDGRKVLPPTELFLGQKPSDSGSLIIGDKGTLYSAHDYGGKWVLLPEKNYEGYQGPAKSLPRAGKDDNDQAQKDEWVAGIKGGPLPLSNFEYASLLAETILLGNIACKVPEPLEWDGARLRFKNSKAADALLHRNYRPGWVV